MKVNAFRKWLDLAATVSILLVCIYIGVVLHRNQDPSPAGPLKGAALPRLPTYSWKQHPKTLVVAIREGCHFCQESLPFYKHLSDLEATNKLAAHLLVVTSDDQSTADRTLLSSGIKADVVSRESFSDMRISATPTLLLVNGGGTVEQAWVGKQLSQGEASIIDAVGPPAAQ